MSPVKRSHQEGLKDEESPTRDKGEKEGDGEGSDSDVNPEDCVEDDEDPESPSKTGANKTEWVALNPFKDIYKSSPLCQMAFDFGQACIPLSAVGMILNYAGNHLLHYISQVHHRKIFYPMTTVTSVCLMANGDIVT
jgi:hypothetical protein